VDASIALQAYGGQLTCIRTLQGRLGELDEPVMQIAVSQAQSPAWRAVMARMHIAQSRTEEARQALADALAQLSRQPPWHYQWSTAVLNLVDGACSLRDLTACERLFELLLPHSGLMTWTVGASLGPYDLALGRLAATLGVPSVAEQHLRRAVALCDRMDAQAYLAIARHELALLLPPGRERRQLEALAEDGAGHAGVYLPGS
jgi:hypothetical protein